jgi:hypothetical protein
MREIVSPLSGFGSPFGVRQLHRGRGGLPMISLTTLGLMACLQWETG